MLCWISFCFLPRRSGRICEEWRIGWRKTRKTRRLFVDFWNFPVIGDVSIATVWWVFIFLFLIFYFWKFDFHMPLFGCWENEGKHLEVIIWILLYICNCQAQLSGIVKKLISFSTLSRQPNRAAIFSLNFSV